MVTIRAFGSPHAGFTRSVRSVTDSTPPNHEPAPNPQQLGWPGAMPPPGSIPPGSFPAGSMPAGSMPGGPIPYAPIPPEAANPVAGQRMPRPKIVETAFRVMLAAWGLGVILQIAGIVFAAGQMPAAFAQAARNQRARGGPVLDMSKLEPVLIAGSALVAAVMLGLWLLFIVKMRQGRDWARVWMLVCGSIGIVGAVIGGGFALGMGMALPSGQLPIVAGQWVEYGLAVVALVLMYRPAARPYFHQR